MSFVYNLECLIIKVALELNTYQNAASTDGSRNGFAGPYVEFVVAKVI